MDYLGSSFALFILGSPYALAGAFLIGTPAHLLLKRLGWRRWFHYVGGGLVVGVVIAAGLAAVAQSQAWAMAYVGRGLAAAFGHFALACIVSSTLAALIIWIICGRIRHSAEPAG